MSLKLLFIKILGGLFVAAVFGGIVFLLRFLYGPKGKFRDPQWDAWNERAREELVRSEDERLARKKNEKTESALRDAFSAYAEGFFSGNAEEDAPLQLKVNHTFQVVRLAEELAKREPAFADAELAHALRVSALFHDVGRFEQLRRFHTFADNLSCNHGVLGARVIREQDFLHQESRETRMLILTAVAAHNRFSVPRALAGPLRPVLLGLRDADKLDILRVMADNLAPGKRGDGMVLLHLKDEPESYSPAVVQSLEQGRVALYRDMRFYNDFRILLCTWLHDFHFPASFAIIKRRGCLSGIIDGLEGLPELRARLHAFAGETLEKATGARRRASPNT